MGSEVVRENSYCITAKEGRENVASSDGSLHNLEMYWERREVVKVYSVPVASLKLMVIR